MLKLLTKEMTFLDSFKNRILLIGFISLYATVFITVYQPFNINQWGESYYWEFILIGTGLLLITQLFLRTVFKLYNLKLYVLLFWCVFEVLIIAFVFYIFYSPQLATYQEKIKEYILTFKYTSLVIVVPYALFLWYMQLRQKMTSLKEIQHRFEGEEAGEKGKLLVINGENGKVSLAIKYHQLLYVKSAGNYLELFYLKGDKLAKELIRGSVKEFESQISDSSVIRIHRSYMVNIKQLSSFKKTRKGYALVVQHVPDEIIPVSLSYKQDFETLLKQSTSH